jgi:hypothetical protein
MQTYDCPESGSSLQDFAARLPGNQAATSAKAPGNACLIRNPSLPNVYEMQRPYQAENAIVNGHKAITPETTIDLRCAFGTSAEYRMNLESAYRLQTAFQKRNANVAITKKVTG